MALINGEPGRLRYVYGRIESAQAFVTDGERIVAIYAVRNPDKLRHFGLSIADVYLAVGRNNANAGGGYIEHNREQFVVGTVGLVKNLDDLLAQKEPAKAFDKAVAKAAAKKPAAKKKA